MADEYSYRTYDGKRFSYHSSSLGKVAADNQADSLRKRGWLVRVTHENKRYYVWKRRA